MNSKLVDLLSIFKQSREKLSQDFLSESLEIFEPMFKYENDNDLMSLSMEKYFTGYINYHFEVFLEYSNIDIEFSKAMLSFVKTFNINVSDSNLNNGKELFYSILKQKESFLQEMITVGNIDSDKFNKLSYLYQKDKTLFDRELNSLKG